MTDQVSIPPAWQVPQQFRDRLGMRVGRQRPMFADSQVLLVLHAPPKPEDTHRVARFFWRDNQGNWKSNDLGSGISALNKHLDEYEERIARLDRQEEAAQTANQYFEVLERLAPLYRAARNLHLVLQQVRKTCPEMHDVIDVRDRAYTIERKAELLYNGTKNSLDYAVARRAEEQARASEHSARAAHRLNILAAFFFPIMTLTAIFGVDLATLQAFLGFDFRTLVGNAHPSILLLTIIGIGFVLGALLTAFINAGKQRDKARF